VLTFKAHTKPIHGLAFAPDGRTLATAVRSTVARKEWARLWNLDDLTRVATFPTTFGDPPVAFSPDGRFFARGGDGLAVYALDSLEVVFDTGFPADTIAFAPDGKEIATFGVGSILERWAIPQRKKLTVAYLRDNFQHGWANPLRKQLPGGWGGSRRDNNDTRFPTGAMAYSPDGNTIALCYGGHTGDGFDSHLLLWDRKTGKLRKTLEVPFQYDHPAAITYSPDGSAIAGIYGPALRVVEVASGREVAAIKPGQKHFKGLAFTPDGRRLIAVNTDAAVRVYDTATWSEVTGYEWQIGKLTAVAVAPDGLRAACGSDRGRVVVWDLDG
jgi:WD40 repeat protein